MSETEQSGSFPFSGAQVSSLFLVLMYGSMPTIFSTKMCGRTMLRLSGMSSTGRMWASVSRLPKSRWTPESEWFIIEVFKYWCRLHPVNGVNKTTHRYAQTTWIKMKTICECVLSPFCSQHPDFSKQIDLVLHQSHHNIIHYRCPNQNTLSKLHQN